MGGLFSSPKQPEIVKNDDLEADKSVKQAVKREAMKARKRKGRLSTVLTKQTPEGLLFGD